MGLRVKPNIGGCVDIETLIYLTKATDIQQPFGFLQNIIIKSIKKERL
jgi:hypothetical protein